MDPVAAILDIPGIGSWTPYITLTIAVCAAVATILPAPGPDASPVWVAIYRALNLVGANFGRARNADDAKASPPTTQGTKP